ncbi:MAG TPA: SsrA-binding protein [Salinimicrobium sp.]|nr:SsrA-binding protein [Salinimicrobium sp.]
MKKKIFQLLSKFNKAVLPSYSKKQLDLTKAAKLQLAIFGWKLWVTKNALEK